MDRALQPLLDGLVATSDRRLERRDHVADDIFGSVVQQRRQARVGRRAGHEEGEDVFDQQRVLRHRKGMVAAGLAVPARDAGKPVGDV